MNVSGRIDTTHAETKEVLQLWKNYLYNKPDSVYINPYWNKVEQAYYLESGMPFFDMGAGLMFRAGYNSTKMLAEFRPTVLSIDSLHYQNEKIYNIKTLFYSERMASDSLYAKWNPQYITSYFCKKEDNAYKLISAYEVLTSKWKKYKAGFINYIVDPYLEIDTTAAQSALLFSENLIKRFNLVEPDSIDYVVASNVNVMGELYNFDYILSYSTAMTHPPLNRIVLSHPNYNHLHELVHILFKNKEWDKKGRPFIMNEGLATFLTGSKGKNNFEEELFEFSKEIAAVDKLTLSDIINIGFILKYV